MTYDLANLPQVLHTAGSDDSFLFQNVQDAPSLLPQIKTTLRNKI